jgi:heat shock protein HslJ
MTRDSLRFGAIISTKMACTDDSRNLLEQKYLGGLSAVTTYQVADSTLTLPSTAGELARFRSP